MYGLFGNKRIVLYDTLLEQCTEDEIVAVLAHELGMSRTANCGRCKALLCSGHWKMSHNLYNFVTLQFILLTQFLLFSLLRTSDDLYVSFGFVEDHPAFISFVLFTFISAPLNEVWDLRRGPRPQGDDGVCLDRGILAEHAESKVRIPGRQLCRELGLGNSSATGSDYLGEFEQGIAECGSVVLGLPLFASTYARETGSHWRWTRQNTVVHVKHGL